MATFDAELIAVPEEPLEALPGSVKQTMYEVNAPSSGAAAGTVYKMRGVYTPSGTRTRLVYWDSAGSPDYAGTGQSEVPSGDLTDISVVEVVVI